MKLIFLDIDGVLNSTNDGEITKDRVERLDKIVKATGAYIVLSTSWRLRDQYVQEFYDKLRELGYPDLVYYIVGDTPDLYYEVPSHVGSRQLRAYEIKEVVDRKCPDKWISLDDLDLTLTLDKYHCITTYTEIGLTDELMNLAIERLI